MPSLTKRTNKFYAIFMSFKVPKVVANKPDRS